MTEFTQQDEKIECFTFGDREPLADAKDLLNYLQCTPCGNWYEPPVNLDTLANTFSSSSYHSSPIYVKRNILTSTFIPHKYLSRQAFERIANDFLILGNCYLEKRANMLRQTDGLKPTLAKYTRRGIVKNEYWYIDKYWEEHKFKKGSVWHMLAPDINQEIYGLPEYLAAINSVWLDNSATVFRQRYYKNGSHAGFILYLSNPSHPIMKKILKN
jgi:PBSX family phage portal protein